MSTQAVEHHLVEETKHQIRTIVGEIQQLSKLDVPPDEYHGEFLHRVVTAMGAVGGAVWTFDTGMLSLSYQVNIKELGLQENEDNTRQRSKRHSRRWHTFAAVSCAEGSPNDFADVARHETNRSIDSRNRNAHRMIVANRSRRIRYRTVRIVAKPSSNTIPKRCRAYRTSPKHWPDTNRPSSFCRRRSE